MCRAGIKGMGLELWAHSEEICSDCVTAIKTPKGLDDAKLRRRMYDQYRVLISGGFGDLVGQLFRIGHMGEVRGRDLERLFATIAELLAVT